MIPEAKNFLIYGSYGYTGDLIARLAVERGLRPILAGRDPQKLRSQAEALNLDFCVFPLEDSAALEHALSGVAAVLHCAGPFSRTSGPMATACLRTHTHYLDITGEIPVFEALAARHQEAIAARVMLLPGAGFDVVPTDCLAAHLKARLPAATHLVLAFRPLGSRFSRGTATTSVERVHAGGLVRREGVLTPVPAAWKTRQIDFGRGPVPAVSIPWGDVSTAYYSTGIPNIEVYLAVPTYLRRMLALTRNVRWLLAQAPVKQVLRGLISWMPAGPSARQRASGLSLVWGEVRDMDGNRAAARLNTPESYALTAQTALTAAEKVLAGKAYPGFQTPSLAYGADFILEMTGVTREDLA
jgi:short subunit dehydrogenase-like uncharacterized protein